MKWHIMIVLMFALILASSSAYAFTYEVTYYINGGTGASITTNPIPFSAENTGTIELDLGLFSSHNTSSSFTYNGNYLSPYSNTYAITSGILTFNSSCYDMGSAIENYTTSQVIESRNTITNDADFFRPYSETKITFTTDDRFLRLFSGNLTDSEQFLVNKYQCNNCLNNVVLDADNITQFFNSDTVGRCEVFNPTRSEARFQSIGIDDIFIYVLFNSTTGNITYSSRFFGSATDGRFHVLYPFDDPNNPTVEINIESTSGNIVLDANRLYVYAVGGTPVAGNERVPDINLTIDLAIADYDCPIYGPCIEGTQRRTCIDRNGIQPNLVQSSTCAITVLENATLGFELFTRETDIYKCVPSFGFDCNYQAVTTSRDTPLNWTVVEDPALKHDFLRMTEEWATDGSRSLKMWYIPPKAGEILTNTTCGNTTSGSVPTVFQNISNDSFSVSFNVTFPAENMLLSFDVKGCDNQALQHSDYGGLLWSNVSGVLVYILPPSCYERCYATSCLGIPNSRYVVNLVDTVTSLSVFGSPSFDTASINRSDPVSIDITNMGLIAGRTYNLVLAVYPENLDDTSGNCVYFDNVRYERIAESFLVEFLNGVCETQCIGNDLYETTRLHGGECLTKRIEYGCAGTEINIALDRGLAVCDGDNLLRLNPKTKQPEILVCVNGCEDDRCITDEEANADLIVESLYAPHEIIQLILIEWGISLEDFGEVWFFNSIFMYINYIAIGLGLGVSLFVRGDSKEAKDFYIPFIVVVMAILVSSTFAGFYPLEVGIPLVVFIGILLWKTSERVVGGTGGN